MPLIWGALVFVVGLPIVAAAWSPLLAWRRPVYIAGGFSGIVALALLLVQPLLIGGYLPGLSAHGARRVHRWVGSALVLSVVVHVGALWITSPADVIDALMFVAPTPFSNWGVISMWAVFATALLAGLRRPLQVRIRTWRICHALLAAVIVAGGVVHAMLIEGTMETWSKTWLCALVLVVTLKVLADLRAWARRAPSR